MSAMPAAWHPDPTGRHEMRWWDGDGWTMHVCDAGVVGVDPPVADPLAGPRFVVHRRGGRRSHAAQATVVAGDRVLATVREPPSPHPLALLSGDGAAGVEVVVPTGAVVATVVRPDRRAPWQVLDDGGHQLAEVRREAPARAAGGTVDRRRRLVLVLPAPSAARADLFAPTAARAGHLAQQDLFGVSWHLTDGAGVLVATVGCTIHQAADRRRWASVDYAVTVVGPPPDGRVLLGVVLALDLAEIQLADRDD
jgi:hypothetical protein